MVLPPSSVCLQCGDRGFDVALIPCATCHRFFIHRYCLETLPPTFHGPVTWYCDQSCHPNPNPNPNPKTSDDKFKLSSLNDTVSSQPETSPVWKGVLTLNLKKTSISVPNFEAHLSKTACEKARTEARQLPENSIPLELLQRRAIWPESFGKWGPRGDSIAIFLFPFGEKADLLVKDMVRHDLALRAEVDFGHPKAQLLFFTSAVLPADYWAFGGRFYLWGVFSLRKKKVEG